MNRIHFPISCCVSGCKTKINERSDLRNRMFPFIRKNGNALLRQRFQLWLKVLNCKIYSTSDTRSLWICRKHFVKGRPASPYDFADIDWVPSLCLDTIESSLNLLEPKVELVDSSNLLLDMEKPFCRLCLKNNAPMKALYSLPSPSSNRLKWLIKEIAGIQLPFKTEYNSFACERCLTKLEEFLTWRERWQINDSLIKTFRENGKDYQSTPAIPIVSIPIERLMEDYMEEVLPLNLTNGECEMKIKHETIETIVERDEQYDQLKNETFSMMEPAGAESVGTDTDVEVVSPTEIPTVDITENEKKNRLIRKVLKKIRREMLDLNAKKS
ncbi:uncharacterized protein LOC131677625 [Topomyia yanbarensis]|uniref:uncharacterized protein LOC131677625 n=1 Tax=Topomyia yanbarensis TaxID=2498891 RepID=UPI00273AB650|nr:uncharacterized protein LOC131677625 [Topomyia yanbarensis]